MRRYDKCQACVLEPHDRYVYNLRGGPHWLLSPCFFPGPHSDLWTAGYKKVISQCCVRRAVFTSLLFYQCPAGWSTFLMPWRLCPRLEQPTFLPGVAASVLHIVVKPCDLFLGRATHLAAYQPYILLILIMTVLLAAAEPCTRQHAARVRKVRRHADSTGRLLQQCQRVECTLYTVQQSKRLDSVQKFRQLQALDFGHAAAHKAENRQKAVFAGEEPVTNWGTASFVKTITQCRKMWGEICQNTTRFLVGTASSRLARALARSQYLSLSLSLSPVNWAVSLPAYWITARQKVKHAARHSDAWHLEEIWLCTWPFGPTRRLNLRNDELNTFNSESIEFKRSRHMICWQRTRCLDGWW